MAPNHGGDPLGSILGPMGSHWGKKWVKTVKNYYAPKFEFSTTPSHPFWSKFDLTLMAPNDGGDPLGSILGPMGSHWDQKMGQNRKKLPCPKIRIVDNHRFRPKLDVTVMAPNHGGDPLGSISGPMGSHWGQNMGQNRKKLPCLKIRIFNYPEVIDFGQNWTTLRIWMGSHWDQKMGQNRKKLPCPKIRIFDYPAFIDFGQNWTLRIWRQIKVGTP